MSTPYVGQILAVGFNFPPPGWVTCNGALLSISEYTALFSLIGTTYGGNGTTTFGIPNLQGRIPIHQGTGSGLSAYVMGQAGGATSVALNANTMPAHVHGVACQAAGGNSPTASGNYFAGVSLANNEGIYGVPGAADAMSSLVGSSGGSQAHDNMQPYLAIYYIMATEGIYPSQS